MSEPILVPSSSERALPDLVFTGTAGGFFRVWIVNLCLTVLTLGIYSAWAKVRTRQYFYRHLSLDGSSFDYDADPRRILIGRMIVVAFFGAYSFATGLTPLLAFPFLLIWLAALPWLIVRSIAFHRRHSLYRNVRFRFHGRLAEAFRVFIGGALVLVATLGLALPWLVGRQQQFAAANSAYGSTRFGFAWRAGPYYKVFLAAGGVFLAASVVAAAGMAGGGFLAGGASAAEPGATRPLAVVFSLLGYLLAYAAALAFYNAGITNLLYNQLDLAGLRFRSSQQGLELLGLYLVCGIAIVASLGLAIPWALVRLAHYRVSRLSLASSIDLGQFTRDAADGSESALASEAADFFDLDFGL